MEEMYVHLLETLPTIVLIIIAIVSLTILSKSADFLVDEAVSLSIQWGIPKSIIGATIVSLGTTLPEASVSVLAAMQGNPHLALGNGVGSIIADTGLILGLAAIIGYLPIDQKTLNRQGRIQIGSAALLVVLALPMFGRNNEGIIHQWMGFLLLTLLIIYLYMMIRWAKNGTEGFEKLDVIKSPAIFQIAKLIFAISMVILSSKILIPSIELTAIRFGIPQSIIAATLVAFGTSLPELTTAIAAVRKGHGELAVGNIIGADILNVLFVVGAAAAVTSKGLAVDASFYKLQFPAMMIILLAFRRFAKSKDHRINKKEGFVLVSLYLTYIILSYTWI
ncbi:calcium/sodium antiporter [Petrocella sp. FN5]|uniref:calcium/sodium antiporter n=1 Tax=Petrocella sp. FN5 TaxID=3032002 RepID=UPI0023DB6B77|nr:calcium/sodium antiporter [Petrocella sp. FN5]MDF1617933.1 calcium/sodium antiporter [Petrocella sp. FN5]